MFVFSDLPKLMRFISSSHSIDVKYINRYIIYSVNSPCAYVESVAVLTLCYSWIDIEHPPTSVVSAIRFYLNMIATAL
ncbi:unnamed protein product [Phytomonas sp. EM1]|nr:unnamed protein product [Phytomonas sp. EM1]|eukprot:CCW62355.1 unnamed protein product [Phytomonas sp. isolate EM1]